MQLISVHFSTVTVKASKQYNGIIKILKVIVKLEFSIWESYFKMSINPDILS